MALFNTDIPELSGFDTGLCLSNLDILGARQNRVSESVLAVLSELADAILHDAGGDPDTVDSILNAYCPRESHSDDWNLSLVSKEICDLCAAPPVDIFAGFDKKRPSQEDLKNICRAFIDRKLAAKEAELKEAGIDLHEVERVVLLRTVDTHWMDHIDAMDQLRQGIGLRAYAQKDPVVAYTNEGFEMFDEMIQEIRNETARLIFVASVNLRREKVAKENPTAGDGTIERKPVKKGQKVGRNDPCPCGSGKKYKQCCGR